MSGLPKQRYEIYYRIGVHIGRHILTYLLIFASIPLLAVGYIKHNQELQMAGYITLALGLLFFLGYTMWAFKREMSTKR